MSDTLRSLSGGPPLRPSSDPTRVPATEMATHKTLLPVREPKRPESKVWTLCKTPRHTDVEGFLPLTPTEVHYFLV